MGWFGHLTLFLYLVYTPYEMCKVEVVIDASINRLSRQLQVVAAIQLEINSQTRSKGGKNY